MRERLFVKLSTVVMRINAKDFSAQSGGSISSAVWKWSGKSHFPGLFPPDLQTCDASFPCPIYFLSPQHTAPGSPRIVRTIITISTFHAYITLHFPNCLAIMLSKEKDDVMDWIVLFLKGQCMLIITTCFRRYDTYIEVGMASRL